VLDMPGVTDGEMLPGATYIVKTIATGPLSRSGGSATPARGRSLRAPGTRRRWVVRWVNLALGLIQRQAANMSPPLDASPATLKNPDNREGESPCGCVRRMGRPGTPANPQRSGLPRARGETSRPGRTLCYVRWPDLSDGFHAATTRHGNGAGVVGAWHPTEGQDQLRAVAYRAQFDFESGQCCHDASQVGACVE
jgi:hypothetical protein